MSGLERRLCACVCARALRWVSHSHKHTCCAHTRMPLTGTVLRLCCLSCRVSRRSTVLRVERHSSIIRPIMYPTSCVNPGNVLYIDFTTITLEQQPLIKCSLGHHWLSIGKVPAATVHTHSLHLGVRTEISGCRVSTKYQMIDFNRRNLCLGTGWWNQSLYLIV